MPLETSKNLNFKCLVELVNGLEESHGARPLNSLRV